MTETSSTSGSNPENASAAASPKVFLHVLDKAYGLPAPHRPQPGHRVPAADAEGEKGIDLKIYSGIMPAPWKHLSQRTARSALLAKSSFQSSHLLALLGLLTAQEQL